MRREKNSSSQRRNKHLSGCSVRHEFTSFVSSIRRVLRASTQFTRLAPFQRKPDPTTSLTQHYIFRLQNEITYYERPTTAEK